MGQRVRGGGSMPRASPLRASSREIVDGLHRTQAAITRNDSPPARPRAISSSSASDMQRPPDHGPAAAERHRHRVEHDDPCAGSCRWPPHRQ